MKHPLACPLLALWLFGASIAGAQPLQPPYPVAARTLSVDQPDPARSFWRDQVHYPFPVKYAKAADGQGVRWEVAYMDEYAGPAKQKASAKTLVLIHGRGTNAATWHDLMLAALKNGVRVIALDIPNYGKSIPGNLDKPVTRSLDDVREVVHQLIVKQLKVDKAVYLGHSLGGMLVFGYALQYPQAVERIIALSPGGLEEFRPTALFNPAFARDEPAWSMAWEKTGMLSGELARTPVSIELDYYFEGNGRRPGYFYKDGVVPRFMTDTRTRMIDANQAEYQRYVTAYVRENYAVGVEVQQGDPHNLYQRLAELKMPVLLVIGEKDPLFPVKTLSGNSDIKLDLIKPFFDRLKANGNPPHVKVYAGSGHFPHTDFPEQFATDVLSFIDGKPLAGVEDVANYQPGVLRKSGMHKKATEFWRDLVLDCLSRT